MVLQALCICVFAYFLHRNVIFDIIEPPSFENVAPCICVFVYCQMNKEHKGGEWHLTEQLPHGSRWVPVYANRYLGGHAEKCYSPFNLFSPSCQLFSMAPYQYSKSFICRGWRHLKVERGEHENVDHTM